MNAKVALIGSGNAFKETLKNVHDIIEAFTYPTGR